MYPNQKNQENVTSDQPSPRLIAHCRWVRQGLAACREQKSSLTKAAAAIRHLPGCSQQVADLDCRIRRVEADIARYQQEVNAIAERFGLIAKTAVPQSKPQPKRRVHRPRLTQVQATV